MENYFKEIDFKRYSSINIGPICNVLVINKIASYPDYQIIGLSNNIIVSEEAPAFAILGEEFNYIKKDENKLYVGAATKSGKLLSYAKKNNIANLEFLGKLPGTLGGIVKMNAGLKEWEIFNYIDSIKTQSGYIKKEQISYSYRETNISEIIYEVVLNIEEGYSKEKELMFKKMRDNQPKLPSAGSCFKNPEGDFAGRLIEAVGLKGRKVGGMSFSELHANFLVNDGSGTFNEAMFLIRLAQHKVETEFKIKLQMENIIF